MKRFTVLLLIALTLPLSIAGAVELWVEYQSDSGIFTARMPEAHVAESGNFAIADDRAVDSEEISALIDQRPYRNVIKSYIIRADQTLGGGLNKDEIAILLERELNLYEDFYVAHGGHVVSSNMDGIKGFPGGEIVLSYTDPLFGAQAIKAQILFSNSTRLEQIAVVPEQGLNSYVTKDFFDSLAFSDGIAVNKKNLGETWLLQESPLGLFTMHVPPVTKPYFPAAPVVKNTQNAELMSMAFKDPVRNQTIYYNIHGYAFERNLNLANVETVLIRNFLVKQHVDPKSVNFVETDDKYHHKAVEAVYNIAPPDGFPFLQSVKLVATYSGPYMIVQEVASSQVMIFGPFTKTLLDATQFTPEHFHLPDETQETSGDAFLSEATTSNLGAADTANTLLPGKLMNTMGSSAPPAPAAAMPSTTPAPAAPARP